jgi:hypothetical protein
MNILDIGEDRMSISFPDIDISINGIPYSRLIFIVRLLTYEECIKLHRFKSVEGLAGTLLEEDVFDLVFDKIVGIDDPINIDDIEAGIISTIVGAVQSKSLEHLYHSEALLQKYENEISAIEGMQAIISRYFNESLDSVRRYPLNKLLKRFALFRATFPQEAALISSTPGESTSGQQL